MKTMYAGQQITVPGRVLFDQPNALTLYVGEAFPGASAADNAWLIKRVTFDANSNPLEIAVANSGQPAIWANRASLEYS